MTNHVLQPRRPALVLPPSARPAPQRPPRPGPFDTVTLVLQSTLQRIDPARVEIMFDQQEQAFLLGQQGLGCLAMVPASKLARLPTWTSPEAALRGVLSDVIRAECWTFGTIAFDTEQVRQAASTDHAEG